MKKLDSDFEGQRQALFDCLLDLARSLRDEVVLAGESATTEDNARVVSDADGDTIFAIDRVGEDWLVAGLSRLARSVPILLLAEGLPPAGIALPEGVDPDLIDWRILADPIDGTRGLMYQKRSAWVLLSAARNLGSATRLSDIEVAVQVEIPPIKQHLGDEMAVLVGEDLRAWRFDRTTGTRTEWQPRPSRAKGLEQGFATIARFFPGGREELAAIDDALCARLLGPPVRGKAQCFEDQYISSGGQLYELMAGHDRFVADLRPLLETSEALRGQNTGICAHPYDLCTIAVARAAGVIVEDPRGRPLDAPLNLTQDVAWAGYANEALRDLVAPALRAILQERGLL
ncbi:MAG: inositol monophosphatase [Planctomycetes bacterium]|nr:inositol monophosphatase [Planctomycetota bacterium]